MSGWVVSRLGVCREGVIVVFVGVVIIEGGGGRESGWCILCKNVLCG